MAIYHLSTKPISRSSGRSAVASVAYRAGIEITDERLGKTYDYSKRSGVLWTAMATPNGLDIDRSQLWNLAERAEKRSNSRTAREIVINIPHELMQGDQSAGKTLAYEFATSLSQTYQIAVDVAVHSPDKAGDNRNFHAHLLLTTRQINQNQDGSFELGNKSQLEMSNTQLKQAGLLSNQDELKQIRKAWSELANTHLAKHGLNERIDHRSHKDRGLDTLPTIKMGWQATELERQGIKTAVGDQNRAIRAYNAELEQRNILKEQQKQEKSLPKLAFGNQKHPIFAKNDKYTDNQNQNTLKNAPKTPIEPRKIKNGTKVAPTQSNTLKTQNRAFLDNPILSDDQYQQTIAFLEQFQERIQTLAKQILQNQLKALQQRAKPILATFEKLRDNEPLFFGKDQWRQDKQHALDTYNAIKEQHDTMRTKGVTDEYIKLANKQLAKDDPSYHEKGKQALLAIALHEQAKLDELAKQYGADKHARANQSYRGKIIQSDNNTSLQQTQDGVVLHRIGNLAVGKGYTLSHDNKTYQVQQDYEIRTPKRSLDRGR